LSARAKSPQLRVHHFEERSYANGPGCRLVLWLQGCTLKCPGCFNPATHNQRAGQMFAVAALAERMRQAGPDIEGLTISGGEPLLQIPALNALLEQIRTTTRLSVLLFTGYDWDEIQKMPASGQLLQQLDVLIAGRYRADQRSAHGLIGSTNKTVHFLTQRYTGADLHIVPPAEITIDADGEVHLSGIDPLKW